MFNWEKFTSTKQLETRYAQGPEVIVLRWSATGRRSVAVRADIHAVTREGQPSFRRGLKSHSLTVSGVVDATRMFEGLTS